MRADDVQPRVYPPGPVSPVSVPRVRVAQGVDDVANRQHRRAEQHLVHRERPLRQDEDPQLGRRVRDPEAAVLVRSRHLLRAALPQELHADVRAQHVLRLGVPRRFYPRPRSFTNRTRARDVLGGRIAPTSSTLTSSSPSAGKTQ